MTFSWDRAWADVVALARAHAEFVLVLAGVFILLPTFALGLYIKPFTLTSFDMEGLRAINAYFAQNWLVLLLTSVVTQFGQATILALLLDARRLTVSQALSAALVLLFPFILLNLITSLAVAAGFFALVIPAVYLTGRFAVAAPAMIAERESNPLNAIARSLALTKGRGWRIVGLIILIVVVTTIAFAAGKAGMTVVLSLIVPETARAAVAALVSALFDTVGVIVSVLLVAAIYRQLVGEAGRHAEIFS